MEKDLKIKAIYKEYYIVNSMEYRYFNIVFTDKEIIFDFINRSFKPWLIRSGAYKTLSYDDVTIEEIKNRSEDNIVVECQKIKDIKFFTRTIFKNAYLKIFLDDEVLTFITKDKNPEEININLITN